MASNPSFECAGFTRLPAVFTAAECGYMTQVLGAVAGAGRRGLMEVPAVRELVDSERVKDCLQPYLAGAPRLVRAIYFDKSPGANWLVPWHQDLTFAVRERKDVPGFGPWSMKDGIPHVQPPVALLEEVVTMRIHLDACDVENGALKVLPGTHGVGRLGAEQIQDCRNRVNEVLCEMDAGDVLLMRPLLLHASGKSTSERHRRILHLEFCGVDLPGGLEWSE
jgi:hypothetical protein